MNYFYSASRAFVLVGLFSVIAWSVSMDDVNDMVSRTTFIDAQKATLGPPPVKLILKPSPATEWKSLFGTLSREFKSGPKLGTITARSGNKTDIVEKLCSISITPDAKKVPSQIEGTYKVSDISWTAGETKLDGDNKKVSATHMLNLVTMRGGYVGAVYCGVFSSSVKEPNANEFLQALKDTGAAKYVEVTLPSRMKWEKEFSEEDRKAIKDLQKNPSLGATVGDDDLPPETKAMLEKVKKQIDEEMK